MGILWNLVFFILALGLLVTVHEFGHFWVARRNGIQVQRFSIGFGKTLFSWHDKLGTEYVIALIPLGGYVRMLDGRIDELTVDQQRLAFDHKSVLQRMAVIFAGPAANFIFAALLAWLMFMVGETAIKPVIGQISEDSIAAHSGLMPNQRIVAVNGSQTIDWQAVNYALVASIGNESITIDTVSMANDQPQTVVLDITDWRFDPEKISAFDSLGIGVYRPSVTTELVFIAPDSAAQQAGLQKGDVVLAIDGQPLTEWQQLVEVVENAAEQTLQFSIKRGDSMLSLPVVPQSRLDKQGFNQGYLGISPKRPSWPAENLQVIEYGFFGAFWHGVEYTAQTTKMTLVLIGKLFSGDLSVKNLSGPVSIAKGAGDSAGYGLVPFLKFLVLISINLGVVNLLPLPILDGGHLFYLVIELIRGKSVSERTQELGFKFGAVILFLLMSIALINDFARL